MSQERAAHLAGHGDDDLAVLDRDHAWTAGLLRGDPLELRGAVTRGGSVALRTHRAGVVAAAMVALDGWAAEVHLLPAPLPAPDGFTGPVLELDDVDPQQRPAVEPGDGPSTAWVLATSGTTGEPTRVRHTLTSLSRTVRSGGRAGSLRWGLVYDPNRMAGLQVLLQGLLTGAPVLDAGTEGSIGERATWLARHDVSAMSATPTLWRQLLQSPPVEGLDLRQITLGGEIADQLVLDALHARFPDAHITHVFASTETGAAFAVGDGRAGFPISYLAEAPRGIRLDVREGILHVHAPGVSTADAEGWVSTGDVVEIDGDRVLFRGRGTGVVNIGGTKVWPEQVEAALREHPDVEDAVVVARSNAFSGQILTATVSSSTDDPRALGRELRAWAKDRLTAAMVPAMITVVDSLGTSSTGKAERR
jgi:acyl-coenzyme A synthetase/AMP-(fatty) acid ligase